VAQNGSLKLTLFPFRVLITCFLPRFSRLPEGSFIFANFTRFIIVYPHAVASFPTVVKKHIRMNEGHRN
jgi:hypothetical protein